MKALSKLTKAIDSQTKKVIDRRKEFQQLNKKLIRDMEKKHS